MAEVDDVNEAVAQEMPAVAREAAPTILSQAAESAEQQHPDASGEDDDDTEVDKQVEALKKRLMQIEAEGDNQKAPESSGNAPAGNGASSTVEGDGQKPEWSGPSDAAVPGTEAYDSEVAKSDARSVYVGNVDYGATVEELVAHFTDCGTIFRVTIMVDRYTGQPKGFAYIEFSDESSVKHATILDNTTFRGRKLKVVAKRTNVPGMTSRGGHYGRRPRYNRGGYSRGYGRRPRRGFRGRWSPY